MKIFKSKIGLEFVAPVSLAIAGVTFSMASQSFLTAMCFLLVFGGFIVYLAFRTYYFINNGRLTIKCGFFTNKIDVHSIRKISETRDLTSSPALSIDRLEIMYNQFDTILVSPKDKVGFINAIKDANPNIELKLKSIAGETQL